MNSIANDLRAISSHTYVFHKLEQQQQQQQHKSCFFRVKKDLKLFVLVLSLMYAPINHTYGDIGRDIRKVLHFLKSSLRFAKKKRVLCIKIPT